MKTIRATNAEKPSKRASNPRNHSGPEIVAVTILCMGVDFRFIKFVDDGSVSDLHNRLINGYPEYIILPRGDDSEDE